MTRRNGYGISRESLKSRWPLVVAAFLLLAASVPLMKVQLARADDAHQSKIYDSTGFERQPFIAGLPLLGTDGWSTAIPPFLNPDAAVITDTASANGRQSVEVRGGDLVGSEGITAPYDAIGSYRRPVNYSVSPKKSIVVVEADLLLDTDEDATEDDFFSLTIAARSGDSETLGEMGLSSSGSAVAYGFDANP